MVTFQELIQKFNRAPLADKKVNTYGQDELIRTYNNIWGIISDTHMSKLESGDYIISGSMLNNRDKFNSFMYAWTWGGYRFAASSTGCRCLVELINKAGYCGQWRTLDGDVVYALVPNNAYSCNYGGCACGCQDVAVASPFERATDKAAIKEALTGTIKDNIKNLNESKSIKGTDWSVTFINEDKVKFISENNDYIIADVEEGFAAAILGIGAIYLVASSIGYKYVTDAEEKEKYKGGPLAAFKWFNDDFKADWEKEKIKSLERSEEIENIFKKYYNEKVKDINGLRNKLAEKISDSDIKLLNKLAEKLKTE